MKDLILSDKLGQRLKWACLASMIINIILWHEVSGLTQRPPSFKLDRIEISRVIIDKNEKIIPHKVIPKVIPKRKPPENHTPPPPRPKEHQIAQPPPVVRHNVMVAKANLNAPAKSDDHVAFKGGNAEVGKPVATQDAGEVVAKPPEKKEEPPPKKEEPAAPPPKK